MFESSYWGKVRGFEFLENGDEIGGMILVSIKKGLLIVYFFEIFCVKSFIWF